MTIAAAKSPTAPFAHTADQPPLVKRKPHVLIFGHGDACERLRALGKSLREDMTVSMYLHETCIETRILEDVAKAEIIIFGPCSKPHHAERNDCRVEHAVLQLACRHDRPLAFLMVKSGFGTVSVQNFGESVELVIIEEPDDTGAYVDLFPRAQQVALSDAKLGKKLVEHSKASTLA
jgi:hypothetical protein